MCWWFFCILSKWRWTLATMKRWHRTSTLRVTKVSQFLESSQACIDPWDDFGIYTYIFLVDLFYGRPKLVGKYTIVPYGCYGFLNKEIRKKLNYGEGGIFTLLYTIIHEQATYCIWLQNGKLMVKWKPLKVVLGGAFSFRINTNIYRQKEFEAVHQCTNTYVHWGHQIDKGLLLHLVWLWTGNLRTWSSDGLIFRTWTSRYDFSCTVNPLGNYSQRMGCIKKGNGLTRLRLW